MKTIKIYCIVILAAWLLPVYGSLAADWGFRGLLPRGTGYYDKNSIRKISDHVYQVWTVIIYNEQGKADAYAMLLKQGKAPENPAVLNQESILLELDCLRGKYRIVSINIYDEKDTLLFSVPETNAGWHDVIPNSINEKLNNTVCKAVDSRRDGHE